MRNNKTENEIDEVKKWIEKIKRKHLKYKIKKYTYNYQQFDTTTIFGGNICTGKCNIDQAEIDQTNLVENIVICHNKCRY